MISGIWKTFEAEMFKNYHFINRTKLNRCKTIFVAEYSQKRHRNISNMDHFSLNYPDLLKCSIKGILAISECYKNDIHYYIFTTCLNHINVVELFSGIRWNERANRRTCRSKAYEIDEIDPFLYQCNKLHIFYDND